MWGGNGFVCNANRVSRNNASKERRCKSRLEDLGKMGHSLPVAARLCPLELA